LEQKLFTRNSPRTPKAPAIMPTQINAVIGSLLNNSRSSLCHHPYHSFQMPGCGHKNNPSENKFQLTSESGLGVTTWVTHKGKA
jgi:hypothetical protein